MVTLAYGLNAIRVGWLSRNKEHNLVCGPTQIAGVSSIQTDWIELQLSDRCWNMFQCHRVNAGSCYSPSHSEWSSAHSPNWSRGMHKMSHELILVWQISPSWYDKRCSSLEKHNWALSNVGYLEWKNQGFYWQPFVSVKTKMVRNWITKHLILGNRWLRLGNLERISTQHCRMSRSSGLVSLLAGLVHWDCTLGEVSSRTLRSEITINYNSVLTNIACIPVWIDQFLDYPRWNNPADTASRAEWPSCCVAHMRKQRSENPVGNKDNHIVTRFVSTLHCTLRD